AYAALASAPHPGALIGQVHARLADTVAGQARDLSEAHDCRDLNTWEAIAAGKSAPFFALALELPLLAAGEAAALTPAGRAARHFALAYQIRDDLEDAARDARCGRLNAAGVLARAGEPDPRAVLASRIGSHLGAARRYAARLPRGAGEALLPVIDAFAAGALEPA
ncbi:MAG: polyprenyl synthetase family protein, partial [Oceanicaulis sp.]